MRVLISGSSGMIGSEVVSALRRNDFDIVRLVRGKSRSASDAIPWNPESGELVAEQLRGFDGVVHLAGENIASARWTPKQKAKIMNSRAQGTRLLCEKLASLSDPPEVLVCASAMGYYGDRGDDLLTEKEPPGRGFMSEVVQAWEAATRPAAERGIRVVNPRFGIVLSPKGGSLGELLPFFRVGLGGPLAGGRQYFSWISISDVVGVIRFALTNQALSGPVNAATATPVRQRDFAHILGKVLHRPVVFDIPRWALYARLGKELADSLLASIRLVPEKLLATGYRFEQSDLETALRNLLQKPSAS